MKKIFLLAGTTQVRLTLQKQTACWDAIQIKVVLCTFLSVSGLKLRGSSRFHKSELCCENKKEKAVWKLPNMDKLIKSFCLVVIHKWIISVVLYGVYKIAIRPQTWLWIVGSANEPKGNWPLESHGINLGLGRNTFCSLQFPIHFYQIKPETLSTSTAKPTWLPSSLSSAQS